MAGDIGATLGGSGWAVPGEAGEASDLTTVGELGATLGAQGWSVPGTAGDAANLTTVGNINAQLLAEGWDVRLDPAPTFALDFQLDPYAGLSPALTYSAPTAGPLIQQYDGSYVQPLAGEMALRGGRRLQNLLNNTDTLATQGVTVEEADYWLCFEGTGSVAVSGVATDSLAGTGVDDRVTKKITMGSAGTATFTVTGSVTSACLYKSRPGQTVADPEYISRGVLSAPYHGYGVDGVAWFNTDEEGGDLTDAATGHPVLCTGLARWPEITNLTFPSESFAGQAITVTNGQPYTISFYGTGSIAYSGAASGTLIGTGADERVSVTITASTTTLTLASPTGTVTKVQVETGSVANLFVPTAGTAVTVDASTIELDPTEIGYVAGGGTWVIEHVADLSASYNPNWQVVLDLWNDANNRALFYNRAGNSGMYVVNGGVAQADGNDADAAWEVGVLQRVAVRFEADDIALVTDGEEHLTDTSATLPTVNTIYLGGKSDSAYQGGIARIAYYAAGT